MTEVRSDECKAHAVRCTAPSILSIEIESTPCMNCKYSRATRTPLYKRKRNKSKVVNQSTLLKRTLIPSVTLLEVWSRSSTMPHLACPLIRRARTTHHLANRSDRLTHASISPTPIRSQARRAGHHGRRQGSSRAPPGVPPASEGASCFPDLSRRCSGGVQTAASQSDLRVCGQRLRGRADAVGEPAGVQAAADMAPRHEGRVYD